MVRPRGRPIKSKQRTSRSYADRDNTSELNLPQCYVAVRKLTLDEISRLVVSPLYIGNKCGRCKKFAYYSPKCSICSVSYHYHCANLRMMCCDNKIIPRIENHTDSVNCQKCKKVVDYGPQCSVCFSKYHNDCITVYDKCCELNICDPILGRECVICLKEVSFGPKCPFCQKIYHSYCVKDTLICCGVKYTPDDKCEFKCKRCKRRLGLCAILCQYCGSAHHKYCIVPRGCCGKPLPYELYIIPSFKFTLNYFNKLLEQKEHLNKSEEIVATHTHTLRSMICESKKFERGKKKNSSCQTVAVDSIAIVDVKSELEDKELDICSSPQPPYLEREMSRTPEPSSSSSLTTTTTTTQKPESSNNDGGESLKSLFDFLFNMVKKFPPHLQTQVKIDLFKIVTEAEMKLQCNMTDNGVQSHAK